MPAFADAFYAIATTGIVPVHSDNGPGFARELLPRIFDPYVTTKPRGTGLGLAIVKHVMSRHGGQLRIASQVGVGSTFACDFPAELACTRGGAGRAA